MDQETQRIMQRCQLNHWKKDLILKFGATEGERIHQNAFSKYAELLSAREIPPAEILDKHLIYMILPLLALYEGLLSSGLAQPQALEFIDQLSENDESLRKAAKSFARLGRLPFFFSLLRKTMKPNIKRMHPPEGWDIHWIENSKHRIAFDVNRCFIYETLKSYGRDELTQFLCKTDDYLYENIAPGVKWERTKTIGGGEAICDFRFIKVHKNSKS